MNDPGAAELPRLGTDWSGDLEGWLAAMSGHDPDGPQVTPRFQLWSFPTDELLSAYVESLDSRPNSKALRRISSSAPNVTGSNRKQRSRWRTCSSDGLAGFRRLQSSEYGRRLLKTVSNKSHAQPGLRWVMDLLPAYPRQAISVIGAYVVAHGQYLPDGRLEGLSDAKTLISARYLHRRGPDGDTALRDISPRELEQLVARLYTEMGYTCELTPPRRDGGRDVIARRDQHGSRERRLIECKHYVGPVPVAAARASSAWSALSGHERGPGDHRSDHRRDPPPRR